MGRAARVRAAMDPETRSLARLRVQMQRVAPLIKTGADVTRLLDVMPEDQRLIASLLLKPYLKP